MTPSPLPAPYVIPASPFVIPAKAGIQCLLLLALGSSCYAAGGHHAVDDAAILDPGTCEAESWLSRARGGERLLHAGGGCRVGPVELGVATEYARAGGATQTAWGVQAKWAAELTPGFSAGLSLSPTWANHVRPRYQGTTVSALATWAAREDLALHLNLGRDMLRGGAGEARSGAAAEWTPRAGWSLLAERYLESQTHYWRAGARWSLGSDVTVDASHARRISGPGTSSWTVGASWLFR